MILVAGGGLLLVSKLVSAAGNAAGGIGKTLSNIDTNLQAGPSSDLGTYQAYGNYNPAATNSLPAGTLATDPTFAGAIGTAAESVWNGLLTLGSDPPSSSTTGSGN